MTLHSISRSFVFGILNRRTLNPQSESARTRLTLFLRVYSKKNA
jgi:hypothetical protein